MAPRAPKRETLYEPRVFNFGLVVALLVLVPSMAMALLLSSRTALPTVPPLAMVGGIIGVFLSIMGYLLWQVNRVRRLIRAHGRFMCLSCHYPLTGLPDAGRCPECDLPYERATTEKRWLEWERTVNKDKPLV